MTGIINVPETRITTYNLTIVSGGPLSDKVNIGGGTVVGVVFPATFTGTSISFTTAYTDTDQFSVFVPVCDNGGTLIPITKAVSSACLLSPLNAAHIGCW